MSPKKKIKKERKRQREEERKRGRERERGEEEIYSEEKNDLVAIIRSSENVNLVKSCQIKDHFDVQLVGKC